MLVVVAAGLQLLRIDRLTPIITIFGTMFLGIVSFYRRTVTQTNDALMGMVGYAVNGYARNGMADCRLELPMKVNNRATTGQPRQSFGLLSLNDLFAGCVSEVSLAPVSRCAADVDTFSISRSVKRILWSTALVGSTVLAAILSNRLLANLIANRLVVSKTNVVSAPTLVSETELEEAGVTVESHKVVNPNFVSQVLSLVPALLTRGLFAQILLVLCLIILLVILLPTGAGG